MEHMLHPVLTYGWILGLQLEVNKSIHTHTNTPTPQDVVKIRDTKANV